nr:Chain B, C-terminal 15-mer from Chemotaxis protein cheZ [synthetic construct]2FLK_B Chain B, C-terminal 15-mer from Chemotaxis protein cheZ [synthetic construct]2FLW_B Chain B, C-terminal 15-mer from Chemotaxis protein cheZ [synthetic construct]2FMF_B Chain B, C-terminal 15-mer from Chemotaxis protein cheZ [synthetic construct]2FMH_B Chain B, C-terminal 15-mer from Chemotaxis protein cheZ [synthetic construct]2FMI_B Chain B, C-terminal 15-mer from Chemotaxis protein cheZ [synthetic construc
ASQDQVDDLLDSLGF